MIIQILFGDGHEHIDLVDASHLTVFAYLCTKCNIKKRDA